MQWKHELNENIAFFLWIETAHSRAHSDSKRIFIQKYYSRLNKIAAQRSPVDCNFSWFGEKHENMLFNPRPTHQA